MSLSIYIRYYTFKLEFNFRKQVNVTYFNVTMHPNYLDTVWYLPLGYSFAFHDFSYLYLTIV